MIGKGSKSKEPYLNLSNLTQADIAAYYLNIKSIPSLIHSPLRRDSKPSFALYCPKGTEVNYKDFSTGESGTIWTLLTKMWNCSVAEAAAKVYNDLGDKSYGTKIGVGGYMTRHCKVNSQIDLQCKVREWRDYDLEYWDSYGISLKWLKYADIYPISHKIIIKDSVSYTFGADKYAYAYVEFKEGKVTLKLNFECPMRNHRSRISLIKQLQSNIIFLQWKGNHNKIIRIDNVIMKSTATEASLMVT